MNQPALTVAPANLLALRNVFFQINWKDRIKMELTEKVLELLTKSEPMRPCEIAEALGADKKDLEKAIKQLKSD